MAKQRKAARPISDNEPPVVDEIPIFRGNVNRHVARSSTFVSFYANDVQLQVTPWDVRLVFSEMRVDPSTENGPTAHITELGEIRLSPQLAKRVTIILEDQLRAYEEKLGTIPQPPAD